MSCIELVDQSDFLWAIRRYRQLSQKFRHIYDNPIGGHEVFEQDNSLQPTSFVWQGVTWKLYFRCIVGKRTIITRRQVLRDGVETTGNALRKIESQIANHLLQVNLEDFIRSKEAQGASKEGGTA